MGYRKDQVLRLTLVSMLLSQPLVPPQSAQTDEPDLPSIFRQDGLSREPDLSANPRLVAHIELAETAELQRELVRAQIVEQGGFERGNHDIHDHLRLFLCWQRQSSLNPHRQLISTSYACS